ncbi:MAG: dynamin family protein [Anaerolineaceae bacterium]|nr:dynamin family protein [Anaerolineaceae bacterium]
MRQSFLTNDQLLFLQTEKQSLNEILASLKAFNLSDESLHNLRKAIDQLDELFLIVAVGEFNAGKSALVNAMLGEKVLTEGVTPTTARVTLVRFGETVGEQVVDDGFAIVTHPLALLKELNIVDSPGTNAINRQHERLTNEFVPHSDLVLFVTSADRPLTESERLFLEKIIAWGKKIVIVINKSDILEDAQARQEVEAFVRENAANILKSQPEVFSVSARMAQKAALAATDAEREASRSASGITALERYITETLDDNSRLELKLRNPLGVGTHLLEEAKSRTEAQTREISEDIILASSLEGMLENYRRELAAELSPRLADVENILNGFENRGQEYLDNTMKLTRILDLAKPDKIKTEFQAEVQADVAEEIDGKVRGLIDWLVDKDLNVWYQVAGALERRQAQSQKSLPTGANPQTERRRQLIDSVSTTIKAIVNQYDRKREAEQLGDFVQESVTQTALFGVGAVGIGALVATVLTTKALDVTGIVTAGALAVLGLFVIPYKRKQAKEAFKEKMAELRENLMKTLSATFKRESDSATQRLESNIAPYTTYVQGEKARLQTDKETLDGLQARLEDLSRSIPSLLV